jgi:molybdopterin/thiamine biosynthesis adenylyltransferase
VTLGSCSLILPSSLRAQLWSHLFPGDRDEHGAVMVCGVARSDRGIRLLGRELFPGTDGIDYVPGDRGYRMLRGEFILDKVLRCRDERLAYLAIHNHGGADHVGFSADDLRSHERGYPALLDVARGQPVGALVVAQRAIAGDIWFSRSDRVDLAETRILGPSIERLWPSSPPPPPGRDEAYDRQTRLFGDAGQDLLVRAKVGVIGAGGVGSLLVEYLARLGVGWIVIADPDRLDITNLPRVVASTRFDARSWFTEAGRPEWLRSIGKRTAVKKANIARRVALAGNPRCRVDAIFGNIVENHVARMFADCDYLFLAADTMQARLVFNALVHQYLIPGVQAGAKVRASVGSGELMDVYSIARTVTPDSGCLWCNGLISPEGLQREAATTDELGAQRYVTDPTVSAPSVITLNATVASQAANDFLFAWTDLIHDDATLEYLRFLPRDRDIRFDLPRSDPTCSECGLDSVSRRARGDSTSLPTREP